MRANGRSCVSRLLSLGKTVRGDMRPKTPGGSPSPRSIGLQRRSTARSRAMAKIPLCGGHPSGPQGPMQVGEAAATDVGGGDRFDLMQNRAIGRAYLAQLYARYKNWPDAIAAYNWGLNNVDTWIRAGRPRERLLAGVATYTMRVLHDSGLCYGGQTIQLRGSARFDADPGFRPAMADPFIHS